MGLRVCQGAEQTVTTGTHCRCLYQRNDIQRSPGSRGKPGNDCGTSIVLDRNGLRGAIAMGDVQSQRQEWASRVIQDLLYANHVKLLLGTATKNFIVEELVQVAELLFNDVWNLPREQSKASTLSSVTTK